MVTYDSYPVKIKEEKRINIKDFKDGINNNEISYDWKILNLILDAVFVILLGL